MLCANILKLHVFIKLKFLALLEKLKQLKLLVLPSHTVRLEWSYFPAALFKLGKRGFVLDSFYDFLYSLHSKVDCPSSSIQFSSVPQSCLTLCDPMNHSTPGLTITSTPVHHQLPESTSIKHPGGLVDKVRQRNNSQTELNSIQQAFSRYPRCTCYVGARDGTMFPQNS